MSRTLTIKGMTCDHCEQTVEEAVGDVPGVTAASADRDAETITVEGEADSAVVIAAVEDAGYEADA